VEEELMTYGRFSMAVLAVGALVAAAGAQGAVLCKKNKTAAVFVRDGCGRKETQINLTDFLSGSGGGGGGGAEPEIDRSGSRLHVRYFVGADGSREFIGFLDTQRNEHCAFTWVGYRAEDGTTRCLPQESLASLSESYFADSSCTQPLPLALWSPETNCPGPAYIQKLVLDQCPMLVRLYEVGLEFAGSAYTIIGSLGCRAATPPSGYVIYTVGAEVPASAFVAASEQVE
jgi:hypothetical protein